MKATNDCALPALDCSDILGRRQAEHTAFRDKLKMVTSSIRQTKDALSAVTKPRPPKTKQANQALRHVICAEVEPCIRTQLDQFASALGRKGGCKASMMTQSLLTNEDTTIKMLKMCSRQPLCAKAKLPLPATKDLDACVKTAKAVVPA